MVENILLGDDTHQTLAFNHGQVLDVKVAEQMKGIFAGLLNFKGGNIVCYEFYCGHTEL
jgi:hypothetical protein